MISDDGIDAERRIYVGLAHHTGERVQPAGLMKLVRRGVVESGEFAYGRRYLEDPAAAPLNPEHLPLRDAAFVLPERRLREGGAMPLTLRDALPDSWGRKVLEIRQGKPLSDIDALLLTNEDRIGAMVFAEALPIESEEPPSALLSLEELAEASRRIEAGMEIGPDMHRLLRGGSLGGARPKAAFVHEGRRFIAKFASRGDDHDVEVIEAATLWLADACGIEVPPFLLQPLALGHALLVERFDRAGPVTDERRFHYLSASALLDVPYESSRGSYVELAQLLRRISRRPQEDLSELFRRLVFNLAVGNSDDHVKNHGALRGEDGLWRLAPAFDLVMQLGGHTGYQELAILPGQHASSLALVREAAPHFGLTAAAAEEIILAIGETVAVHAAASVASAGGDPALVRRVAAFIEQQAGRIAA
ncbi:type II toxin-antitoxin system HipA family toxin [Variovorax boronicumulans]|uniref:type II toxin-antitoxin system HipA family toxin n=1 Tax=Variovorax boronicumulans TaxID=436515 RepID=UPI002787B591|nr:HipA domain-containing protein [Variovorax boronicumulans]MDQ0039633.1 serine/threonine-protein kinase HipA [Variovorax boronicumulans]